MAPEKAPAFQFYAEKFLLDERQAVMTLAQSGAYVRLMAYCWRELTIPDDPDLCRVLVNDGRVTVKQFREMWPLIRACFDPAGDGRLKHPTLEREREKQAEWRQKSATGGRHSQARRKGGSTTLQAEPVEPPLEPKGNIPVSSLQSLVSVQRPSVSEGGAVVRPVPVASGPHRAHAFCWRACVPAFLHDKFRRRLGGAEPDDRLRAWYLDVSKTFSDEDPITVDDVGFWETQYALKWGDGQTQAQRLKAAAVAKGNAALDEWARS